MREIESAARRARTGEGQSSEVQTEESSFGAVAKLPVEMRELVVKYSEALVEATRHKYNKN